VDAVSVPVGFFESSAKTAHEQVAIKVTKARVRVREYKFIKFGSFERFIQSSIVTLEVNSQAFF
jgi:hypothetical protein